MQADKPRRFQIKFTRTEGLTVEGEVENVQFLDTYIRGLLIVFAALGMGNS